MYFLSKVCKAQMAILGDGRGGVFCENSLDIPNRWQAKTQDKIALNKFDVVITNPPYGSKIKIDDKEILKQFEVGLKWKKDKKTTILANRAGKAGVYYTSVEK